MKLSHLLIFAALASFVFGLGLLVLPSTLLSFYGVAESPASVLNGRFFGAALLGLGLVSWLARHLEASVTRQAILPAFVVNSVLGAIVAARAVTSGVMSSLGWSVVAIYLLLALGFLVFLLRKPGVA